MSFKDYMQGWPVELQNAAEAAAKTLGSPIDFYVKSKNLTAPPPSPALGDRYLIYTSTPTGAWAGHGQNIAEFRGIWHFTPPNEGLLVWVDDEDMLYAYASTTWVQNPIPSHAIAGPLHTATGLTVGHVLRATGATTFAFGQVQHADLGGVSADQHHAQVHVLDSANHTVSGLTTGHVVRSTGATTFAFGQVQIADIAADSGGARVARAQYTFAVSVYIDTADGNDANDGLTPTTAKKTWAGAMASIQMSPEIYVEGCRIYMAGTFTSIDMRLEKLIVGWHLFILDGHGEWKSGYQTTTMVSGGGPFTTNVGSSSQLTNTGAPWTVDQFAGYMIEITGPVGCPCIGQTRMCQGNTATVLTPTKYWTQDPTVGGTVIVAYRIARPTTTINGNSVFTVECVGNPEVGIGSLYFAGNSILRITGAKYPVYLTHIISDSTNGDFFTCQDNASININGSLAYGWDTGVEAVGCGLRNQSGGHGFWLIQNIWSWIDNSFIRNFTMAAPTIPVITGGTRVDHFQLESGFAGRDDVPFIGNIGTGNAPVSFTGRTWVADTAVTFLDGVAFNNNAVAGIEISNSRVKLGSVVGTGNANCGVYAHSNSVIHLGPMAEGVGGAIADYIPGYMSVFQTTVPVFFNWEVGFPITFTGCSLPANNTTFQIYYVYDRQTILFRNPNAGFSTVGTYQIGGVGLPTLVGGAGNVEISCDGTTQASTWANAMASGYTNLDELVRVRRYVVQTP